MLVELVEHLLEVQPHLRGTLRQLDIDFLVLHAKLLDLGHIGHAQQLLAHIIGQHLELGIAETFGLQRIDHAIDIAEVVIEKRSLHTLRQGVAHVADFLAHRVPELGHLLGGRGVLELEDDLRLPGLE